MNAAFKRLRALGAEVLAEVDAKLRAGTSPSTVALWLLADRHELGGTKHGTLKRMLVRYRQEELLAPKRPMDALAELSDLAAKQKARLDRLLANEDAQPGGSLSGEARAEAELLKDILADLGQLQTEGEDGSS